jgi:hypothetical protein
MIMIKNLLYIFTSFACISASKIEITSDSKKTWTNQSSDTVLQFVQVFLNAPNQARCQRVFFNIENGQMRVPK